MYIKTNAMLAAMLLICLKPEAQNTGKPLTNTFHLVKDINAATDANPTNFNLSAYPPNQFAALNNIVYYAADDGIHGRELWRSDGTAAGTKMVKDIYAGETGSLPENIIAINGKLYFSAQTAGYGQELWTSDGTNTGTKMLKDMVAGAGSGYLTSFCNVNGALYFFNEVGFNFQLWKSDGTKAGTVMVTDLTAEKNASQMLHLTAVNNLLFFTAENTSYTNRELWRSDGTAAGTYMVKDINPDPYGAGPSHLTAYNNKLYFCEYNGANQYLWVSDGTTGGTNYAPGYNNVTINTINNSSWSLPFAVAGGIMYLTGNNAVYGSELFKYNSNNGAGVVLVKDINGSGSNTDLYSDRMVASGDTVFFTFTDGNGVVQLWKTTGSANSTVKINDLINVKDAFNIYNGNGMIYFNASTAANGMEVWRSNGTAAGTGILKDIYPGSASSNPAYYTACNNKMFFRASNASGSELWITDGTAGNTALVKNENKTISGSSSPAFLTGFNSTVIFSAYTPDKGTEPYVSDGTSTGTYVIKDIVPDEKSSTPKNYKVKNNFAYFVASNLNDSTCIFKTTGTINNAIQLTAIAPSLYNALTDYAITDNGIVFYIVYNAHTFLYELWRTDGTAGGTLLLKPGLLYYPSPLTAMGNNVYFAAEESGDAYGTELWKSDGTATGTKILKDIIPGLLGSNPFNLYVFNGTLYFVAYDAIGSALWKTNGTTSGTKKIKAAYPTSFQGSGNILYFTQTSTNTELWITDGSPSGTKKIKDIGVSSSSNNLTDVNGVLFFTAYSWNSSELWKTSGTTGTTQLVKEIPAASSNFLAGFTAAASKLFFLCFDVSISDYVLWVSNGTDSGTHPVADDGLNGVSLSKLKGNGNQLYLVGSSHNFGSELYVGDASVISLKRTDTVTKVIAINTLSAKLTANPFGNQLSINISSADKQKVKLIVSDASGNVYYTNVIYIQTGNANCKINTAAWSNGVYIIKLSDVQGQSNIVTLKAMK